MPVRLFPEHWVTVSPLQVLVVPTREALSDPGVNGHGFLICCIPECGPFPHNTGPHQNTELQAPGEGGQIYSPHCCPPVPRAMP